MRFLLSILLPALLPALGWADVIVNGHDGEWPEPQHYDAFDCGSQACQDLFPTIHMDYNLDLPVDSLPKSLDPNLTRYGFGGWNPDHTWGALDVCDSDGDCMLDMIHNGEFFSTNSIYNWSPEGITAIINSSGMTLARFNDCSFPAGGADAQYISTIGCVSPNWYTDSLIDGGLGDMININDSGYILQRGGKYDMTILVPAGDPPEFAHNPEPGSLVLLLGAIGCIAVAARARRVAR